MKTELTVDEDAMKLLVSKAILDGLSLEKRDTLLQGAIEKLFAPTKDRYGSTLPNPLQLIFEEQAKGVATELVREELDAPAAPGNFRYLVEEMIRGAIEKCLDTELAVGPEPADPDDGRSYRSPKEKISEAFAIAILEALRGKY